MINTVNHFNLAKISLAIKGGATAPLASPVDTPMCTIK